MRIFKNVLIAAVVIAFTYYGYVAWKLTAMAATEKYPDDTYLKTATVKKALVIVAHDDDAIGCSGTVAMLVQQGWEVHMICFYSTAWKPEEIPVRKEEVKQMVAIQHLSGADVIDFSIHRATFKHEFYMPVPYAEFDTDMKTDSLKTLIGQSIAKYKPSVIFTTDDIMGGYGHPEHIIVSRCVNRVCSEGKLLPRFSVQRVYQSVYPPSQAETTLGHNPVYVAAKKVYNVKGMPLPNVQVDILNNAGQKKDVMTAYVSQQRNIRKVWPYYNWYPACVYFRINPKEYFKTLDVLQL